MPWQTQLRLCPEPSVAISQEKICRNVKIGRTASSAPSSSSPDSFIPTLSALQPEETDGEYEPEASEPGRCASPGTRGLGGHEGGGDNALIARYASANASWKGVGDRERNEAEKYSCSWISRPGSLGASECHV